jgi:hypothetical protein
MISFTFTEQDRAILDEARRQAKLAAKYARDFERDEDKLLPAQYPEAEGLPGCLRPFGGAPAKKMVPRRADLRHLRGHWRNPASDYRAGSAWIHAQEAELARVSSLPMRSSP